MNEAVQLALTTRSLRHFNVLPASVDNPQSYLASQPQNTGYRSTPSIWPSLARLLSLGSTGLLPTRSYCDSTWQAGSRSANFSRHADRTLAFASSAINHFRRITESIQTGHIDIHLSTSICMSVCIRTCFAMTRPPPDQGELQIYKLHPAYDHPLKTTVVIDQEEQHLLGHA